MLTEYQKFQLPDLKAKKHLKAEVNWNPDDKLTNESQVVKFTCPNGEEILVKRDHLNEVLFALGRPEDQQKMIPQAIQVVHWQETVLGIKATKDIRKGEMINFPIKMSFPCTNTRKFIGQAAWKKEVDQQQKKDKWR